uniref:CRISPR-associated endonuclease Cas1 n=1 Tax=Candidatus Kentrum sp. FW TaxID=2126338 RepID=A0A450SNA9_9GAMM|nr:MAG: CRISPR-associated protein, Cas1 family [Candidatus Kentron sp. FW]VFJ61575.1 MAG: CRISPR-associated protein, Cas1 family [Candidatus Kentron sp. FW]
MIGRVVEIAREGAHLSLDRGFLRVSESGGEVGRVAVEDIGALIVRGYGATISINLCSRLSEAGVPIVLCGANQSPDALIWPVRGHFEQGRRMQAQAEAGRPLRKRLWRDLVAAKVGAQEAVLAHFGKKDPSLRQMIKSLKSGDPENIEAQAARRYWPRLMGEDFRRDRSADGANGALNYGYTVLRAAAARAILAAGLHPSLSVHHESRGDALRLADDLMEPFRPYVDRVVAEHMAGEEGIELDQDMKAALVSVLTLDLAGPNGARPVQSCLDALAVSLAMIYMGENRKLDLPGGLLEDAA